MIENHKLQMNLVICSLGIKIINKNVETDNINHHTEINHSLGDDKNITLSPNHERYLQREQKSTLSPFNIGQSRSLSYR